MTRKQQVLAALVAIAGLLVAFRYYEQYEEGKLAQARAEAAQAVIKAIKEREKRAILPLDQQDKLVSRAQARLDAWQGSAIELALAGEELGRVLKSNPRHVQARIQMARYHLDAGYINYKNFQPGTLEKATWELTYALEVEPNSAEAYVLLGHISYLRGFFKAALSYLEKAQSLGASSPWLHLNWADVLAELGRWVEAESHLRQLEDRYAGATDVPGNVMIALHEQLAGVYAAQRKLKEADGEYRTLIRLTPGSAWTRGNYAGFLLFAVGQPDAAIKQAQEAIEIMDYGMAHLTLAAAHYAKWAQLKRGAPSEATKQLALAKAESADFSWIMPQAANSIGSSPVIEDMVKAIMGMGVSINTRDEHGDTGLSLAAYSGNLRSVERLARLGANIEALDNDGRTPLRSAVNRGHVDVVSRLAKLGAKLNTRDLQGFTPLRDAALDGDKEMVQTLIAAGADVNFASHTGVTPLMDAAYQGHEQVVRILLEARADPLRRTTDSQRTAADMAETGGHAGIAALLREVGTNARTGRADRR